MGTARGPQGQVGGRVHLARRGSCRHSPLRAGPDRVNRSGLRLRAPAGADGGIGPGRRRAVKIYQFRHEGPGQANGRALFVCADFGHSVTMKMLIIGVAVLAALWLLWRRLSPPAGMVFKLCEPRMEIAKQTARDTLPEFWAALAAAAPGDSDFGLKFDLNHGRGLPDRELIWAMGVTRDADGSLHGHLANPPRNRDFSAGQSVVINPATIVDWCFFRRQ